MKAYLKNTDSIVAVKAIYFRNGKPFTIDIETSEVNPTKNVSIFKLISPTEIKGTQTIDPKKKINKDEPYSYQEARLKEIMGNLQELGFYCGNGRRLKNKLPTDLSYYINLILKEFVHKDSLPSIDEIGDILLDHKQSRPTKKYGIMTFIIMEQFPKVAKAIRKLIEGNK